MEIARYTHTTENDREVTLAIEYKSDGGYIEVCDVTLDESGAAVERWFAMFKEKLTAKAINWIHTEAVCL